MPYRWTYDEPRKDAPSRLILWPHQSMTGKGFVTFIGATAVMLALPLIALLGSPVIWVLLAFFLAALWGIWFAIMKNREHMSLHEELSIARDRMELRHFEPARAPLTWEANPYWVSVHLHDTGPVEKYLTLRGSDREVELGAFLSPEERTELHGELQTLLARLR